MDDVAFLSVALERKRQRLRDLLWSRHTTDVGHVQVRISTIYDTTRMLKMAIAKDKKEAAKKAEFKGFFNFEMSAEEKSDCKTWIRQDHEVALAIEDALACGYSIKVGKDGRKGGYQATMQANDPKDPNAGLCMSAYAKHWYDTMAVLMYKHQQCLLKVWKQSEETPTDEDFS